MKTPLSLLFIGLLFISATQVVKAQLFKLEYNFQKRDSTSLLIKISFTGEKSGSTLVHLPNEWAGQKMLYKAISEFNPVSKGTAIEPTEKPFEYLIKYPPHSQVALTYVLSKDWVGPLKYPLYFRPVVKDDLFYFEGYSGLVYPDISDSVKMNCKITYIGFAKDEFTGNSFFSNATSHRFKTNINHLLNSFYCAGKYRSKTVVEGGHKITMAVTGSFLSTDDEIFSSISNTILAERNFWNDGGSPYFFTILLPLADKGITGGTAHYNSFCMFQSTNLKIAQGFIPLISHEYFHNWVGQGLKMPDPGESYNWFMEGFTDYYSLKLLSLRGTISKEDFTAKVNQYIREYYLSPYFKTGNNEMIGKYYDNMFSKLLPYRRGLTIAFMLDCRISEKKSVSLDNLMRSMYKQSKPELIFSETLFDQLVLQYAGKNTLSAINNANQGNNEQLSQNVLDNTFYKTTILTISKIFDLGFDLEASKKAKKIIGLKSGSNAERAGLSESMEITNQFSIWNNDTEKPAKVRVLRNGVEDWIIYIPAKEVNIEVPQIIE